MANSISSSQKKNLSYLDTVGDNELNYVVFKAGDNIFHKYAESFTNILESNIKSSQVTASGNLVDSIRYEVSDDGKIMTVYMADYYDYVNKGVKGVKSSKNAPGSPYKYKNYGMNSDGQASIKKYILSGHAKIKTVQKSKDKALGIGSEKKHLALIDVQTNTLIYLIKKYGIKKTGYFDKAVATAFKNFAADMAKAMGEDILTTIVYGNNN